MTARIEKTVFISYRRTNFYTALAVYQDLTAHGYDVFFDFQSIDSGDFEKTITENIKAKAHFLIILSPSALERCSEPGDWLRREIEMAMDEKRNIVPLMMEGFDFGSPSVKEALSGKLATLNRYNGLRLVADYFFEAMEKLRGRFLNITQDDIALHPVSDQTKEITETQRISAQEAAPVETRQLTSEEWFERAYVMHENKNYDEAIRCYTEAIRLNPSDAMAYNNRGCAREVKGDLDGAIQDYNEAIHLEPNHHLARLNRGSIRKMIGDLEGAIPDLNEVIRLKPDDSESYYERGIARFESDDLDGALSDLDEAIRLKPDEADYYSFRGNVHSDKGDLDAAILDFNEAIRLKPDDADYYSNRGNVYSDKGDLDAAILDFNEAIRLKPDEADFYYFRGNAYSDKGDLDAAMPDFDEAIHLNPNDPDSYESRGFTLSLKGDNLNSLSDLKKASELEPENGIIRSSLTRILKLLGRVSEADEQERVARQYILKEDEYDQACFEAICGNTDKALELLKKALVLNQSDKALARKDPDFENIRYDPRFKELVGE